jgi:hypothetical protein
MKKTEIERPEKILLTVMQYRLLQILAARAGMEVIEFLRMKMGEQIGEVVVSNEVRDITQVIAVRQPLAPTDMRQRCTSCQQAVFLHDEPPPGVPVVCVECAGVTL